MVFSSNIFLFAFLPLTLFLYFVLPQKLVGKKYKNYLLLIASLIFYSWGEAQYLWLLLLSIVGNYFFGLWICSGSRPPLTIALQLQLTQKNKKFVSQKEVARSDGGFGETDSELGSRNPPALRATSFCKGGLAPTLVMPLAIFFNLALLGYFKYANFLVENFNQISPYQITLAKVHLPIGISFFTFHAISYLVDIYRRKCKAQKNIFDLALYIAFFPQLIAGPIVRYNFIEKYLNKRRHNLFFVAYGIRRFAIGMGKKVIIANPLGELADVIFSVPATDLSTPIAWVGIACYTLQIYFDFSGYSDMAVGLARICGFKFPENFNYPYISRSIKEFWRRWHMSLSAWFRDYVYIPLGGNRVSVGRQYFNLVLVFFLCGLWHGASWNFIVWGMFHGCFLVAERVAPARFALPKMLQHFYAIFIVMVGWVFFRSPDLTYALSYLHSMFANVGSDVISNDVGRLIESHFVWMSAALALIAFTPLPRNLGLKLIRKNKFFLAGFDLFLLATLVFCVIRISASTHNPFIYFQF